ncbi:hypothetical protein HX109_04570 [Galbibacter sp. BG1]|uniref:hypothetical protein n=1 Tax=Galbibacter sp. BG1 TaxID=1170699 RepID=UPI0015C094C6|nr:hypothetical protein [Galbibacter sp. BG1]QLE00875.1 hypothetical protein HX109_04570 [Galbibacter sp. BG1]
MRAFSKLISFIFNPLFIPLAGTALYFLISPKYNPPEARKLILLAIAIVTVVIPFIFYLLLKNLGWITSSEITQTKERKLPLIICTILIYITLIKITPISYSSELYFYFVGILGALISALIMVYLNFKISLHTMGISGLATFILGLSIHYEINITMGLALLVLCLGMVATARLHLKSHKGLEIIAGMFIGVLTQFITFGYWL